MLEDFSTIPLFVYPNYKFTVKLGLEYFVLEFVENIVNNSVCLNIYNNNEVPVLLGIKVSAGINLINGVGVANLPKGSLILITKNMESDLIVGDSLDNVHLLYSEEVFDDFFEALA